METTLFDDPRVAALLGSGLAGAVASAFASMEIAEEEIAEARGGNSDPDKTDPLWRSFALLRTTHDRMATEIVYRAHCREILARVRDGKDTRPATDAEILCFISEGSLRAPLGGELVGLQMRLFARALPEQFERIDGDVELYEQMHGPAMNEWEQRLRRKLRQDWRQPTEED